MRNIVVSKSPTGKWGTCDYCVDGSLYVYPAERVPYSRPPLDAAFEVDAGIHKTLLRTGEIYASAPELFRDDLEFASETG